MALLSHCFAFSKGRLVDKKFDAPSTAIKAGLEQASLAYTQFVQDLQPLIQQRAVDLKQAFEQIDTLAIQASMEAHVEVPKPAEVILSKAYAALKAADEQIILVEDTPVDTCRIFINEVSSSGVAQAVTRGGHWIMIDTSKPGVSCLDDYSTALQHVLDPIIAKYE